MSDSKRHFSASANKRFDTSRSSEEYVTTRVKSQLNDTTKVMDDFKTNMTQSLQNMQSRVGGVGGGNGGGSGSQGVTTNNARKAFNMNGGNPNLNSQHFQQSPQSTQSTQSTHLHQSLQSHHPRHPMESHPKTSQHEQEIRSQASGVIGDIKSQIANIKRSMSTMNASGMKVPQFAVHPGAGMSLQRSKDGTADSSAATDNASSANATATATPTASLLSGQNAVQGLQQINDLLRTTQDMMGATTSIGNTLQALKNDDRYPTDWNMGVPYLNVMDYDQYRAFKERYYDACWQDANATCLWKSGDDTLVGQHVTSRTTSGQVVQTKTSPFEMYCMEFDAGSSRVYVGGNRQIPSPSNNGAILWEPILLAFDYDAKNQLQLNTDWFTAVQTSMEPLVSGFVGTGMYIKDIKINPEDGSLFVLMNCMASPDFTSTASSILFHLTSDGKMDEKFNYLSIPTHFTTQQVTGTRLAYSMAQSIVYIITYKRTGSSILPVDASTGQVNSDLLFDMDTYLCDLCVSNDDTKLYVTGYNMTDLKSKSCEAFVVAFDMSSMNIIESFGTSGSGFVPLLQQTNSGTGVTVKSRATTGVTAAKSRASKSITDTTSIYAKLKHTRGHRICMTEDGKTLLVFGSAMSDQFIDDVALQIWSIDATTGTVSKALTWKDPLFSSASYNVEDFAYDYENNSVTLVGGIRFAAYQNNSTEIWIARYNLNDSTIQGYHLPCTPDSYASARSCVLANGNVLFQNNMQTTKMTWGRQSMLASIPSLMNSSSTK